MMTHMNRTLTSLELSADRINEFGLEWIAAWNAHDINRILSHYRDDVQFVSPLAARAGAPHGEVCGRSALRDYFERGLASYPALRFQPIAALAGVRSVALHYHAVEDREAIEVMEFDARGRVRRANVHYTAAPSTATP
jgi:SnoaL-like domain